MLFIFYSMGLKQNPFDKEEGIIGEGSEIMFVTKNIENDLPPRKTYHHYVREKEILEAFGKQMRDMASKIEISEN